MALARRHWRHCHRPGTKQNRNININRNCATWRIHTVEHTLSIFDAQKVAAFHVAVFRVYSQQTCQRGTNRQLHGCSNFYQMIPLMTVERNSSLNWTLPLLLIAELILYRKLCKTCVLSQWRTTDDSLILLSSPGAIFHDFLITRKRCFVRILCQGGLTVCVLSDDTIVELLALLPATTLDTWLFQYC